MRKICAALLAALLLCGCGKAAKTPMEESTVPTETVPAWTAAPDGDPNDVTCKGSYTGQGNEQTVIAVVGDRTLTNAQLAAWYWAAAAQYRQSGECDDLDYDVPLDVQSCGVDDTVASWQQYFLRQALNAWHTAAALNEQSLNVPLGTEEAYQPADYLYEEYMDGMPATKYLYGYDPYYSPNSMHQAYLDGLDDTLNTLAQGKGCADAAALARQAFGTDTQSLTQMAEELNRAYMYFTQLTYDLTQEETEEEISGEYYVNFRHILLKTEGTSAEEALTAFQEKAAARTKSLTGQEKQRESVFADLAHWYSEDTASAVDGGSYLRVLKDQLPEEIGEWCFAPERQPGDTTQIVSGDGVHILYFSGKEAVSQVEQAEIAQQDAQLALIREAKEAYPMEVTYSDIVLPEAEALVSSDELLYPDIAHERFPEIPLYLQQDYPTTMYGGWPIRTNGCGITSMAMVASYLADELLTPPEMCRRYGNYSHRNGTDGMIYFKESPAMGFYLIEQTYEPTTAWRGLEDGHVVISVQHKGYWTSGGHYIVIQEITEDGNVRVRDSNIYNYRRVSNHALDEHTWTSITSAGSGFWIFDDKITRLPACSRCGDPEEASGGLVEDYYCRKCAPAQLRRGNYLESLR
ncbi:MAG: peptidylprolyl isomerase [Eubacteriales bacterium]|nr:peptidylprolyl isomerase [Eubacteriales bacterium]